MLLSSPDFLDEVRILSFRLYAIKPLFNNLLLANKLTQLSELQTQIKAFITADDVPS